MIDVQKKTLLDIHKAIEAGKTGEAAGTGKEV